MGIAIKHFQTVSTHWNKKTEKSENQINVLHKTILKNKEDVAIAYHTCEIKKNIVENLTKPSIIVIKL